MLATSRHGLMSPSASVPHERNTAMMNGLVKRNANAALVNRGEMGFWVIARINGKLVRLHAGGTIDKAMNVYNWYRR